MARKKNKNSKAKKIEELKKKKSSKPVKKTPKKPSEVKSKKISSTPSQIIGPLKNPPKTGTMKAPGEGVGKSIRVNPIQTDDGIPENRKLAFIIAIIFLILIMLAILLYFTLANPSKDPTGDNGYEDDEDVELSEEHVSYLIFDLEGWRLHAASSSGSTPKIKTIADGDTYVTEVSDMEVKTQKKATDVEDITITTTKLEIINALMSPDIKEYMIKSVSEGNTTVELKSSYSILISKGYSNFYRELTGKSLSDTE